MNAKSWTSRDTEVLVPARRGNITVDVVDGEALLFDPDNGNTYQLNQTAFAAWKLCDGKNSNRQIATRLTETYEVTSDVAVDHVDQLAVMFAEARLLECTAEP